MEPLRFSKDRSLLIALLGIFLALLFFDLPNAKLFDPDETRYAEIPREMIQSNDWLTLELNGSPYYEKPPLLYWLNAASMKVLGQTPWAARLPTRLACLGTVLLLVFMAGARASPLAGLWSAFIYISSLLPFALGRINLTDGVLSFFLTLGLFSFREYLFASEEGRSTARWQLLIGFSAAMAMLTKGLLALVFPGMIVGTWSIITGRWRRALGILSSWAPVIFLLLTVPVFWVIEKHNPGFNHFFIVREHFQRYSTNVHQRTGPIYYFVPVFLLGFLPWTIFFFPAVKSLLTFDRRRLIEQSDSLFFGLWFLLPFLFFSMSHSKLIPYLLPCMPAAAALVGKWLVDESENVSILWRRQMILLVLIALAGVLIAPHARVIKEMGLMFEVYLVATFMAGGGILGFIFSRTSQTRAILIEGASFLGVFSVLVSSVPRISEQYCRSDYAQRAMDAHVDTFVCFKEYAHSIPWTLNQDVPVVCYRGELDSLGTHEPEVFLRPEEFWNRWNSKEKLAVMIPRGGPRPDIDIFNALKKKPVMLAETRHSMLIVNFDPKGH